MINNNPPSFNGRTSPQTRTVATPPRSQSPQSQRIEADTARRVQHREAIHEAVRNLDVDRLKALLNAPPAGGPPAIRDAISRHVARDFPYAQPGDTLLHALASGDFDPRDALRAIGLLQQHGANPNASNYRGETPVMRAFDMRQISLHEALTGTYDPGTAEDPSPTYSPRQEAQPPAYVHPPSYWATLAADRALRGIGASSPPNPAARGVLVWEPLWSGTAVRRQVGG